MFLIFFKLCTSTSTSTSTSTGTSASTSTSTSMSTGTSTSTSTSKQLKNNFFNFSQLLPNFRKLLSRVDKCNF